MIGPPDSRSHCIIGLVEVRPVPSSTVDTSVVASLATAASRAAVRCRNTSRGVITNPAALARATSWIEVMLSPPRSKNPSSTPTSGRSSSSAMSEHSTRSVGVLGSRCVVARTGSGSALTSSFPLRVNGRASTTTNALGTM